MVKSTPAIQREAFERGTTEGTDLSWALRAMLWGYNDVQRHIARQMNLGASDVAALEHLLERPDLGPADIASLVGMSTASATVLVDRLETAGHVERRAHPQDRRRKQLAVTEHAKASMFQTLQPLIDTLMSIDQSYDRDQQAVIKSYLRRVGQAYEDYVNHSVDHNTQTSG